MTPLNQKPPTVNEHFSYGIAHYICNRLGWSNKLLSQEGYTKFK